MNKCFNGVTEIVTLNIMKKFMRKKEIFLLLFVTDAINKTLSELISM